jgi:hypothetical protein
MGVQAKLDRGAVGLWFEGFTSLLGVNPQMGGLKKSVHATVRVGLLHRPCCDHARQIRPIAGAYYRAGCIGRNTLYIDLV